MPTLHQGQPVRTAGVPLDQARLAVILLHGRGATATDILTLADDLAVPDCAYLAPQAANNTWYPNSFLAPLASNEPWLSAALQVPADLLAGLAAAGFPPARVALIGFSQGACLTLEFVARHAQRYAAIAGLSGGLIGPAGTPRAYPGTFAGTPVFLGCSDVDVHVPAARVQETAAVLEALGAAVTTRLYPQMAHTVNADELAHVRALIGSSQF